MTRTQRLKGTAALAAAMIVTAAMAGAVLGQDSCEDDQCLAEQSIRAFVEALVAADATVTEEALSELFTDMRPLSDPEQMADLFESADIDEQAIFSGGFNLTLIEDILTAQGMAPAEVEQIVTMSQLMGLVGEDGELLTEGLPLDFLEQMLGGEAASMDAGGGLTLEAIPDSSDETSVVINHEEQYDPDVLEGLAVADPAGTVEAVVAAAAAQRGIDPTTLQQMTLEDILGLLAEE